MKRIILAFALLALPQTTFAQDATTPLLPVVVIETANAKILTPDFVRASDFIAVGRLSIDTKGKFPTTRLASTGLEVLKGNERGVNAWYPSGMVLPTEVLPFKQNELTIVFGQYNPLLKKVVLTARLDAVPENIEAVRKLVAENPTLKIEVSTDKQRYLPTDKIQLKWSIQNVSPTPKTIYIGPYALQYGSTYDNTSHSTGTGGSHDRSEKDYLTLAPNETWTATRLVSGPFPQGSVGIEMTYDAQDNWVNKSGVKSRVENVVFTHVENNLSVEIAAPDAALLKTLAKNLDSPIWSEQYDAALVLAQTDDGSKLPAMRALVRHPWPQMRIMAARALTKNAPQNDGTAPVALDADLKALIYDPNRDVRRETLDLIRKRGIGGVSLSAIALANALDTQIQSGLADKESIPFGVDTLVTRLRDGRVGELLAARVRNGEIEGHGFRNAYVLNYLAENFRNFRYINQKELTDDERNGILKAWDDYKANYKTSFSEEDLAKEVASASASTQGKNFGGEFVPSSDYEKTKAIVDVLGKNYFPKNLPEIAQLQALPESAMSDILQILQNRKGSSAASSESALVLEFLTTAKTPTIKKAVWDYMLGRAYDAATSTYSQGDSGYFATLMLAQVDEKAAAPHLKVFLESKVKGQRLGAALAFGLQGQKSVVPIIFELSELYSYNDMPRILAAIEKTTGQKFDSTWKAQKWWQETGSKMEWK